MSAPYDSHNFPSFTLPKWGGNGLHVSVLYRLTCLVALLLAMTEAVARPVDPVALSETDVVADSTEVHFRQSRSNLDLSLDGNGERLENLLRQIKIMSGRDSIYVLNTLRVIGSASPEGSEQINYRLSEKRARVLFDYFAQHVALPDSITDFEYLGRNWRGLYNLVASDRSVPSQTEVLALLRRAATGTSLTTAESNSLLNKLKTLKGGVPYAYMYTHLFPALRYSFLYVQYEKRMHREIENLVLKTIEADEAMQADSLQMADGNLGIEETAEAIAEADLFTGNEPRRSGNQNDLNNQSVIAESAATVFAPKTEKPFYMDLHTNMLFDIAAVPNIGAEFYVGKNFSVLADWMYGWWSSDPRHRYWRIYGGELGARWWFGSKAEAKPLTGHHVGIYAGVLTFDFEWGGTGYMGGKPGGTLWDRCLVNTGIEYGYSLPISRRLNMDFAIGLGYLGGNYIKYFPFDNEYYRQKEYKLRYFGPTKAEISLVWLIGRGNTNAKSKATKANANSRKGGEQ